MCGGPRPAPPWAHMRMRFLVVALTALWVAVAGCKKEQGAKQAGVSAASEGAECVVGVAKTA